jgi:hypothetical protein
MSFKKNRKLESIEFEQTIDLKQEAELEALLKAEEAILSETSVEVPNVEEEIASLPEVENAAEEIELAPAVETPAAQENLLQSRKTPRELRFEKQEALLRRRRPNLSDEKISRLMKHYFR